MKLLYGFLFLFIGITIAEEIPEFLQYKEGQRYFLYPTKDGQFKVVDLWDKTPTTRFNPSTDTVYNLYTKDNPTVPQVIVNGNSDNLTNSNYDSSKPVKVIVHGWNDNSRGEACTLVRNQFLENMDVNVICVDWTEGANENYAVAATFVSFVGETVADFIDWLVVEGTDMSQFHIMGHSLGAHVVGHAGRNVNRGQIPYITGFDPSGQLFGSGTGHLRPSDGAYVEVIHTNGGTLGTEDPIGHNDFYPNRGKSMPGCTIIDVNCSHHRSYRYFAYSIDNTRFMANECRGYWTEINIGFCSNLSQLHMGGASPKDARGTFYLQTANNPPYHLG